MTVNTTKITSGPYTGNGVADTFSYTFTVYDKNNIAVFETDDNGFQTRLTVDTDYILNDIGVPGGGTITRKDGPLPVGYEWYIRSDYKETQLTSFGSQGAFFPDIHERAMDKLTYLIQQILDKKDRTLSVSDSYSGDLPLSLEDPFAGLALRWNSTADGIENYDPSTIIPDAVPVDKLVVNYSIVDNAINDPNMKINQACNISGRDVKGVGGGMWDVHAAGTFPLGRTVLAHNSLPLQIKLRLYEGIGTTAIGADADVNNGTSALSEILGVVERITVDNEIKVNNLDIGGNKLILLNGGGVLNADTVEGGGVFGGAVGYNVTKNIIHSDDPNCHFEIRDRLIVECGGTRNDGNEIGRDFGGNSQAPIFAERAFLFENCKFISMDAEIRHYLAAGDSLTGNFKDLHNPTLDGNFADVAFAAQNCIEVEVKGRWENNGSEMTIIRDTNPDSSKITNLLFKARCHDNHRSHLWYMLKSVIVEPSFLTKHEASPINAFSDNQVMYPLIIDDVRASHGIDLSEGILLTRNVQIMAPIITNVDDSGIYAATVGLKVIGGWIFGANYGVRNLLGFVDTVTDILGDTYISGLSISNVNVGAIQVTGKRTDPQYSKATISDCKIYQNIIVPASFGINIQSTEDVDIVGNVIQGMDNPITATSRVNRLQIERNTFDQIHGKENQGGDDILIDNQGDTSSPIEITISRNQFKQPPSPGNWSFTIENFDSGAIKDVNLIDNEGYFYYRVTNTDINYRREYKRRWQGSIGDGSFEGGARVWNQIRSNTDISYWQFIQYDGNHNLGVTMGTNPTATASIVNGSNEVTMSPSASEIKIGQFVNIGGVVDNLVVAKHPTDPAIFYTWKNMTSTATGLTVEYNGNVRVGYLGKSGTLTSVI